MHQILSKGIGIAFALMFAIQALGHNPQVSSLAFNNGPSGTCNLMLRAPLLSFQLALQHQFPGLDINNLTPEEFRQRLTMHVRKNITINGEHGRNFSMDSISIALGHEVLIMGKLNIGVPFSSIYVISNQVFSTLKDHFCILSIEQDGKEFFKTVLNRENEFTAQVNKFSLSGAAPPVEGSYGQVVFSVLFIILMIFLSVHFFQSAILQSKQIK